jgi:hypothetical protein
MKVFLSWSGPQSQAVAEALGPWLKSVKQSVEPWISTEMESGIKWIAEVNAQLDTHSVGIICVTPDNVNAPWLNYEAGALAKHLGDGGRVIPYLLGFDSPSDLKEPLAQFNAVLANEEGSLKIIKTLNNHAEFKQDEPALQEAFDLWWPKLRDKLKVAAKQTSTPKAARSDPDKLDEVLALVREISRSSVLSDQFAGLVSGLVGPTRSRTDHAVAVRHLEELIGDARSSEKGFRASDPLSRTDIERREIERREMGRREINGMASSITRAITEKKSDARLIAGEIHDNAHPPVFRISPPVDADTMLRIEREFNLTLGSEVLLVND